MQIKIRKAYDPPYTRGLFSSIIAYELEDVRVLLAQLSRLRERSPVSAALCIPYPVYQQFHVVEKCDRDLINALILSRRSV